MFDYNYLTDKQKEKLLKRIEKQKALYNLIKEDAYDIVSADKFRSTKEFMQHGNMSVQRHSINVAKNSILISEKLHIKCNQRDMIRGALLHDYFLYDWHNKNRDNFQRLHGFYHPGIACKNAAKDYDLTPREENIIKRHMWPLTIVPPLCREAWIVTTADKYCSLLETLHIIKGKSNEKSEQPAQLRVGLRRLKLVFAKA